MDMNKNESILRFSDVSFAYAEERPLLREVNFSVRRGTKTTIMGQNGAGKSTIFSLIAGDIFPEEGTVNIVKGVSIAVSRQVIPRNELDLSVREFFEKALSKNSDKKIYDIDPKIENVLNIVHLEAPHEKTVRSFSGGQQARLLLASALIQNPDLLLLDEPTNNLDKEGIEHLTDFLIGYGKTCIVISHDADFLNRFTDGVLYLDVFTKRVEQYVGNYFDLREQIAARQEKENRKNALLMKEIREKQAKANYFANKGGEMRMVAKRMRKKASELEEEKVELRKEDKTINSFVIPSQKDIKGKIIHIFSFKAIKGLRHVEKKVSIELRRNEHLLIKGPNGIGKSTLLESIVKNDSTGASIAPDVRVGYYRQDFSTLNFEDTVYESLSTVSEKHSEEAVRKVAAGFFISGEIMNSKIGNLSEGQKGLVAFSRLVLQEPGLLILDEPTNHINFRHIPVIAEALNKYDGAMIVVSHASDFVEKIRIDKILDLED